MIWNHQGVTREVFLTRKYAIKIPKLIYGWRNFLQGLLANMQECDFNSMRLPELCPIVFSLSGGWLVIMKRAEPLTQREWENAPDYSCLIGMVLPIEFKRDSYGKLDGRIVAVDYG